LSSIRTLKISGLILRHELLSLPPPNFQRGNLLYKIVSFTNLGFAAGNVTETKFIWKKSKIETASKRSFFIQMALFEHGLLILNVNCASVINKRRVVQI
jgi:hypothetical protein